MIRLAVAGRRRHRLYSGLCGQAASDYPEMAQYLVAIGIDSISFNADAPMATTKTG
jgi:pyruvate, water dikinase